MYEDVGGMSKSFKSLCNDPPEPTPYSRLRLLRRPVIAALRVPRRVVSCIKNDPLPSPKKCLITIYTRSRILHGFSLLLIVFLGLVASSFSFFFFLFTGMHDVPCTPHTPLTLPSS